MTVQLLRSIYWKLYIVRLSLRWVRNINIGDLVIYDGMTLRVSQGVRRPIWTLRDETGRGYDVHESNFRKVRSIKNYVGSFRGAYYFYMVNWYAIWMRSGIKPWMRSCNIWGR